MNPQKYAASKIFIEKTYNHSLICSPKGVTIPKVHKSLSRLYF